MSDTSVQSLDRTFDIIENLCNSKNGLTISELTKLTGLNKTTVYRLLSSLVSHGYVQKREADNRYYMTFKLYRLSSRVIDNLDLVQSSRQYMDSLSKMTNETVHLVVPNGNEIVYVYKVEAENGTIRMFSRIGMRRPMYCTGVGKAMMAYMPEEERKRIWNSSTIEQYTEHTITDLYKFENEVLRIREEGCAYDNEENELGIRCIAVPVFDYSGKVCGALSISAPVSRMDDARLAELKPLIKSVCKSISASMGYFREL